jgi:protein involved in polysaccharide export with SLBB domain
MRNASRYPLALCLGLLAGCISPRERFDPPPMSGPASGDYRLIFPDAVEIQIAQRSDLSGIFPLSPEGRIDLPALESPRVEGDTLLSLRQRLSNLTGLPPHQISCRIAQFKGQFVYIYGTVKGPPRSISFEGPETVVSLLQRAGGLDPGAALRRVYVVRSNLQRNMQPQVFEVDLHAILKKDDPRSNVTILPLDEVYVGETNRSILFRLLPGWLKFGERWLKAE